MEKSKNYGRLELKQKYHKYFMIALIIAASFHFLGLGSYFVALKLQRTGEDNIPVVRILKYTDIGPPPSIQNSEIAPTVSVSTSVTKPSVGIPVPVPDANVSPEATIASQNELSNQSPDILEGTNSTKIEIQRDINIEPQPEDPDINTFIPVEKQPTVVSQPTPKYPELAQRAGIEGNVWVKILVDKEGKPKKAVVIKSDAEVFNEEAKEAAMNSKFTPAVMNNGPVICWVAVQYKFRLK
jgi:protein TonB